MSDKQRISLGDRVVDKITGFSGIVVSRTEWLYGCVRLSVQPEKLRLEGKPVDAQVFDEPQLELVQTEVVSQKTDEPRTYGERDDATALRR
jgi:hypothetical protein